MLSELENRLIKELNIAISNNEETQKNLQAVRKDWMLFGAMLGDIYKATGSNKSPELLKTVCETMIKNIYEEGCFVEKCTNIDYVKLINWKSFLTKISEAFSEEQETKKLKKNK